MALFVVISLGITACGDETRDRDYDREQNHELDLNENAENAPQVTEEVTEEAGEDGEKIIPNPDDEGENTLQEDEAQVLDEAFSREINAEGYYVFGNYEQDGNTSNGAESIEWEILEDNEDELLVISRYILDCQPYHVNSEEVTWDTCTLRAWLNNEFYNTAFNEAEKAWIKTSDLSNTDNPYFGTDGGSSTQDKVFCLNMDEVLEYYEFNSWDENSMDGFSERLAVTPTEYAKQQGLHEYTITEDYYNDKLLENNYNDVMIGHIGAWWWLRSPGMVHQDAELVNFCGHTGWSSSKGVTYYDAGVRPVIRIRKK